MPGLLFQIKSRFSIASANCFNMCYKQFMHKLIESCIHILILMMHTGALYFYTMKEAGENKIKAMQMHA